MRERRLNARVPPNIRWEVERLQERGYSISEIVVAGVHLLYEEEMRRVSTQLGAVPA